MGLVGHTSGIIHHASAHQFIQKQSQVSSCPQTVSFGFQELPETHSPKLDQHTASTPVGPHVHTGYHADQSQFCPAGQAKGLLHRPFASQTSDVHTMPSSQSESTTHVSHA